VPPIINFKLAVSSARDSAGGPAARGRVTGTESESPLRVELRGGYGPVGSESARAGAGFKVTVTRNAADADSEDRRVRRSSDRRRRARVRQLGVVIQDRVVPGRLRESGRGDRGKDGRKEGERGREGGRGKDPLSREQERC
jgi:hypothetical protein